MTEERNNMLPVLGGIAGAAAGAGGGLASLGIAKGAGAALAGGALGMGLGSTLSQGFSEKSMAERERAENERRNWMNQQAALDAHQMNNEGVMTLANRGFELGSLNPLLQQGYLGTGLTNQSVAIGMEMADKARQAEALRIQMNEWEALNPKPEPVVRVKKGFLGFGGGSSLDYGPVRDWEARRDSFMQPLQQQVAGLNYDTQSLGLQKQAIDRGALMDISESYKPLSTLAQGTAAGMFDGSLYGRELAATQPVWDVRGELDPMRRSYLPQLESAEMAMTDPARFRDLQQLAIERAEALRSPETAALRLEAADPAYLAGIQDARRQQADAYETSARMAAQRQLGALGANRVYGGSSTATNRLMANVMNQALQNAAEKRLANQITAGMENEEARRQMVQQQLLNVHDDEKVEQALIGAQQANEQQRLQALRENQQFALAGIGRRQDVDAQGITDRLATADEQRKLTLQNELRKIANINLPFDMQRQSMQALTAPSREYAGLQLAALQPLQFGRIGPTNFQPVSELPYRATPDTGMVLGTGLGSIAKNIGGIYAQNQQNEEMKNLQDAAFKNQRKLQRDYLDRRFPNPLNS